MVNGQSTTTRAIVSRGPLSEGQWSIEHVVPRELGENEVKVKVLSVGLCHTDLTIGSTPKEFGAYPGILGHEGCGIVLDVGTKVTTAVAGDKVLLSFSSCKSCFYCLRGHPAYCILFIPLNMGLGDRPRDVAADKGGLPVKGTFFGQSSFSEIAIVSDSSVVNVSGYIHTEEELKLLSPLGCGLQTGAGAVMKLQNLTEDDSIAIFGLGAVGLAAVMAARIRGIKTIIAIDRIKSRLDLAKTFGATHTMNTALLAQDFIPSLQTVTSGLGVSVSIDATGNVGIIKQAIEATRNLGKICMLGVPPPGTHLDIDINSLLGSGKQLFGSVEGDVNPSIFIPELVEWYRQGNFPIDKIVKYYPIEDFMKAISDMRLGDVVKPILCW